jgi:hypothetical protein
MLEQSSHIIKTMFIPDIFEKTFQKNSICGHFGEQHSHEKFRVFVETRETFESVTIKFRFC